MVFEGRTRGFGRGLYSGQQRSTEGSLASFLTRLFRAWLIFHSSHANGESTQLDVNNKRAIVNALLHIYGCWAP